MIARTTTRPSRGCSGRNAPPRRRRSGRALVQGAGPRRRKPCRRRLRRRRRSRNHRRYPASREKQGVRVRAQRKGGTAAGAVAEAAAAAPKRIERRRRPRRPPGHPHAPRSREKRTRVIPAASRGRWPSRSGTAGGRQARGGKPPPSVSYRSVCASVLQPLAARGFAQFFGLRTLGKATVWTTWCSKSHSWAAAALSSRSIGPNGPAPLQQRCRGARGPVIDYLCITASGATWQHRRVRVYPRTLSSLRFVGWLLAGQLATRGLHQFFVPRVVEVRRQTGDRHHHRRWPDRIGDDASVAMRRRRKTVVRHREPPAATFRTCASAGGATRLHSPPDET